MSEPVIKLIPVSQGETIRPGRIRDLWANTLAETGRCPRCSRPQGEYHLSICVHPGIVGSNPDEWYI